MLTIGKTEIHLWLVHDLDIVEPDLLEAYLALLDDEEMQRYRRFVFEKHRRRFLVTRALARTVLSQYEAACTPRGLSFHKNPYGKPHLSGMREGGLHFNISHTEGMVALAVVLDRDIGVDVEQLARQADMLKLAWRHFSPQEVRDLQDLDADKLHERFFDLWTLKEAYIKACGQGLAIPLEDFCFRFAGREVSIAFSPQRDDNPARWRFWQLRPDADHKLALAVCGEGLDKLQLVCRHGVPLREFEDVLCEVVRASPGRPVNALQQGPAP